MKTYNGMNEIDQWYRGILPARKWEQMRDEVIVTVRDTSVCLDCFSGRRGLSLLGCFEIIKSRLLVD